jgi:hypothetical protein
MQPPPEFVSPRLMLYQLHEVVVEWPEGGRLGPISWLLERGRRIRVQCAEEWQWSAFAELLTGQRPPAAGRLEELNPVSVQTDLRVREQINPNRSLQEYLESTDAPALIWIGGRRRSLHVLVDALGITPAVARRPARYLEPEDAARLWALRFLLSRARLMVARELMQVAVPEVREVLGRCWGDLAGSVVACEGALPLPGPVHGWVAFAADGSFSAGAEAPETAAGEMRERDD